MSTTRRRRWILAVLAGLIMTVGITCTAAPARADGLDDLCQTVPAPVRPDYQVSGLVMDKPDLATVPDAAPDPFKDPSVPISDVYGWSWRFTNYDLGCGNDFIRDPSAVATTASANFVMAWMATITSWIASLEHMARTGVFDWLQGIVTSVADTLKDRVLTVWLPVAAVLLSIVVVFTSRTAGYADTMRRLGMLLGSILLAVVTLVLPAQAMKVVTSAADTAADVAQAGFTSDAADLVTREAIYKTWLVGNFGSADSPIAQQYGPRLMSALTYTWSDVKRMTSDPGAKAKIDQAKATEFKTIAGEIQKKDPTAYQSLTGKTDTRTAPATMGVVWVVLMGIFVAIACFMIVMAKLVMLGLILYGMVASVVGVLKFSVLQHVWDLFTAAVVNIVKFTLAAGLMTLVLSALSTAPVGVGWRMLLAIIATVIAIMFTRPVRSFKAMAGMDPNRSAVVSIMKRAVGTAVGTVIGNKAWDSRQRAAGEPEPQGATETSTASETTATPQPVEPSQPRLPPPPPLRALPVSQGQHALEAAPATAWAGYTAVGGRVRPVDQELAAVPQPTELPASTGRPLRALPAGTTVLPVAAAAAAGAAAGTRAPDHTLTDTGQSPPPAPEPPEVSVQPPITVARSSTHAADDGSPAVYPTGIVLSADPTLYRSSSNAATSASGEYLRFNEPQVDENGQETWEPIYHAETADT
ncbi:MAG TPA: hypothetical protein VFU98_15275 [Microlunatus sp.]|nr:hypothetical protein [Microlunatus sp.]